MLLSALLLGCGDDRVAGGSGTHLPKPTARLLDTNLQPLQAEVWRLWRVDGDQAVPTWQIVDPSGFLVPDDGLWIVEAWRDTAHAGGLEGLSAAKAVGMDSCTRALTVLPGTETSRVGVVACRDLAAPSRTSRAGDVPLGVGIFGARSAIQQIVRVPTYNGNRSDAYRFMVWKIEWERSIPKAIVDGKEVPAQVPIVFVEHRISAERGLVDISVGKPGYWLFVGWGGDKLDDFWKSPADTLLADSLPLSNCLTASNLGACKDQPVQTGWPDAVDRPSVHFVVGYP
ncbi:MAG TPA: hypothetical protein PKO15_08625 [Fibrobacteria bacterium]|nr:hypothetical protein [Fibrobacteria bacterium]